MIATENINSFWASLLVEELVRNDVTLFCISPGSRSAPLTVAAARHPQTQCFVCHDERGAAFFALGYARASGTPAALICTSGTAAANYFPAVVEASMDAVPMILLTADRPPELLDTGENQTIQQQKLYGNYTRWDFTFPTPISKVSPRFVLTTVDQAVYRALHPVAGPVHLNFMFREPLAPEAQAFPVPSEKSFDRWQKNNTPLTFCTASQQHLHKKELLKVAEFINKSQRGLVTIGRLDVTDQQSKTLGDLLTALGWPVYADIASGFRLGLPTWPVWDEKFFWSHDLTEKWSVDTVIHLGGSFVSKQLQQWLEKHPPSVYMHVHDNPRRIDPGHLVTHSIKTDVTIFCADLFNHFKSRGSFPKRAQLSTNLHDINLFMRHSFESTVLSEPAIAHAVSKLIPDQHGLFLGNSLPIREMNTFAVMDGPRVPIATNRGASGIDGNIATAAGFAMSLARPVTALIGDIAALHDLNSLMHLKTAPVILIILNNDGGGIFSFLPISQHPDVFEKWFETPHGRTFSRAAELFDLAFEQPSSLSDFENVYHQACSQGKSAIIEIKTDKNENFMFHKHLEKKIKDYIDSNL